PDRGLRGAGRPDRRPGPVLVGRPHPCRGGAAPRRPRRLSGARAPRPTPRPLDRAVKRGQHDAMALTPPSADGIEIWYTTDGDASGEPLLMVMGLGAQYLA